MVKKSKFLTRTILDILTLLYRNPEVISRVHNSSEFLAEAWALVLEKDDINAEDYLQNTLIKSGLGIQDATHEELEQLKGWKTSGKTVMDLAYIFADMVSRRALVGVSRIVYRDNGIIV